MASSRNSFLLLTILLLICTTFLIVFVKFTELSQNQNVKVYFIKPKKLSENDSNPFIVYKIKVNKYESPLFKAIDSLLDKPQDNLVSEIPPNTTILNINETPSKFTVNLSDDFAVGGGSLSMGLRLSQLIATIKPFCKNKPVYLEINGQLSEYIGGEGIEVPQPLCNGKVSKKDEI